MIHSDVRPVDRAARHLARLVAFVAFAALVALLVTAPSVNADGGARLVVEPPVAEPGAELSVHGSFLWTETDVVIEVVTETGATRQIGDGETAGDGSLEFRGRLPADLPDGSYVVRVTNGGGETVHVELIVRGAVPWLAIAMTVGAAVALAAVAWSGLRRRRRPG